MSWLVIGMGSMAYGKEKRAVTVFKHMPRVKPYFLTSQWEDGTVSQLLRENGFDFTPTSIGYLGRARIRWTLLNIRMMPRMFWTLLRQYRKQRCRGILVLALQPFANTLPPVLLLKCFAGARVVFYLGDIPSNTLPNRVLSRVVKWMGSAIIVNSHAVARGLRQIGLPEERIQVVYNGTELGKYRDAEILPFRKQFGWPDDAFLVGYAGQFSINKGVGDFVQAAEIVLRENDNCRFVLIGKPDHANLCYRELVDQIRQKNLQTKVVFAGWIREMERAYAALNIMVVPSRHEDPAPNVNIEAMASGVPVIATRTGGSPELIADGETGFLVDRESPEQIVKRILQLTKDRTLLTRLGAAARERACACFDARKNALAVQEAMLTKR